ncbi:MAG: PTS sugar transporter subunit IIA [Sedimentisphaerales bacterium]|nr:PTS sugar transporter subunit IIA [Sedimentisphaerales bacterium]
MTPASNLSQILSSERIVVLEARHKRQALEALIESLSGAEEVKDREELSKGIFYREELMSTGIGMGIAVPHVRLASIDRPVMCVGICRSPILDYGSLDNKPVSLIFMIAAGKNQHAEYLRLLSSISAKVKQSEVRDAILTAPDVETAYRILTENGS